MPNNFAAPLEEAVIQLLNADPAKPAGLTIVPGKYDGTPQSRTKEKIFVCPRLVVNGGSGTEAIYQSGIYKQQLSLQCVTDVDNRDAVYAQALFDWVMDFVQRPGLKIELTATGLVFIHGFESPETNPNQVGDREWIDEVTLPTVGMATPQV